ncbi:MAG TPA: hypothetical protein ENF28_08120 [Proteobacteria bacterium]|nr:hypothetical protein [Pseudomonadota bacterium]
MYRNQAYQRPLRRQLPVQLNFTRQYLITLGGVMKPTIMIAASKRKLLNLGSVFLKTTECLSGKLSLYFPLRG